MNKDKSQCHKAHGEQGRWEEVAIMNYINKNCKKKKTHKCPIVINVLSKIKIKQIRLLVLVVTQGHSDLEFKLKCNEQAVRGRTY